MHPQAATIWTRAAIICTLLVVLSTHNANCGLLGGLGNAVASSLTKPVQKASVAASQLVLKHTAVKSGKDTKDDGNTGGDESDVSTEPTATTTTTSADEDARNSFEAMCFTARDSSWNKHMSVYFYLARDKSVRRDGNVVAPGCTEASVQLVIDMNKAAKLIDKQDESSSSSDDNASGDDDDDNLFDRPQEFVVAGDVQRDLIDSRLFDARAPSFLLIHGFSAAWNSGDGWMCAAKDRVLNATNANVMLVDWSCGAQPSLPMDYGASVANTKYVGIVLGELLRKIIDLAVAADASQTTATTTSSPSSDEDNVDADADEPEHSEKLTRESVAGQLHLVGHSLGAHISGFIGYALKGRVGRILALDPAGPCFNVQQSVLGSGGGADATQAQRTGELDRAGSRRLSPQSARLVVALHTDTALFGLNDNCAHFDVYVNGGSTQPGCSSSVQKLSEFVRLNIVSAFTPIDPTCAHSYAHSLIEVVARTISGSSSSNKSRRKRSNVSDDDGHKAQAQKCFPIAYECASWDAFKAGECGVCAHNQTATRCVFTGLSLSARHSRAQIAEAQEARRDDERLALANRMLLGNKEVDERFNDETADLQAPDVPMNVRGISDTVSRGRHFIKTSPETPTCRYHYQIVIATSGGGGGDAENDAIVQMPTSALALGSSAGHVFYVELRLGGKSTRLVRVSHKLKPHTWAWRIVTREYLQTMRERATSRKSFDSFVEQIGDAEQLHYYTALITFASLDSCTNSSAMASSARNADESLVKKAFDNARKTFERPFARIAGNNDDADDKQNDEDFNDEDDDDEQDWPLCKPLFSAGDDAKHKDKLRVWSTDKRNLKRLEWVAVNHMSGLSASDRLANSRLFAPATAERQIETVKASAAREAAKSARGLFGFVKKHIGDGIDRIPMASCAFASLSMKHNAKCQMLGSGQRLQHSIKLRPLTEVLK